MSNVQIPMNCFPEIFILILSMSERERKREREAGEWEDRERERKPKISETTFYTCLIFTFFFRIET